MDELNKEQERALRIVRKYESIKSNRKVIESTIADADILLTLHKSGFLDFSSSIDDPFDSDYQHVSRTTLGGVISLKEEDRLEKDGLQY